MEPHEFRLSNLQESYYVAGSNRTQVENANIRRKPVASASTYQVLPENEEDSTSHVTNNPIASGYPRKNLKLVNIWWMEFAACALMVLGLIAIIVTVNRVHNQPLPTLPLYISVNTLIAIFATVLKTPALFVLAEGLGQEKWSWFTQPRNLHDFQVYDDASRGPWGAVQLLWHLRHRSIVAALGSIAILAAILVDPLSQQLVRFYDCPQTLSNQTAAIPRTNCYDELGGHIGAGYSALSVDLIKSMAVGQFSSSRPQVPFACSSGNCTFTTEYSTTGYCSRCIDVSDRLSWRENSNTTQGIRNITIQLKSPQGQDLITFTPGPFSTGQSDRFIADVFGNISMVWYDGERDPEPLAHAFECLFYPCVHTLNASVVNGILNEQILGRSSSFRSGSNSDGSQSMAMVDLGCVDDVTRQDLSDLGYVYEDDAKWLHYNVSVNPSVPEPDLSRYQTFDNLVRSSFQTQAGIAKGFYEGNASNWTLSQKGLRIVPSKCIYQLKNLIMSSMYSYLRQYFAGRVLDTFGNQDVQGQMIQLSVYRAGATNRGQNGSLAQVANLMQNITDSMTTYMRWHGNVNMSDAAVGVAYHTTVCVHVRWGWLAFDATFVLVVLLFFLCMVINTRSTTASGVFVRHDLKSSVLATLFHGFDRPSQERLEHVGSSNTVKELADVAKQELVTLRLTEGGLKLSYRPKTIIDAADQD